MYPRPIGVSFVPCSPLGRGFLTGRFQRIEDMDEGDWRRQNPRFTGENFQHNLHLAETVKAMAEEKGCTPAQLALAWVLAQGEYIVPIPGTRHIRYLEDNLGAVDVELSNEDLKRLDEAFPFGAACGERYPEAAMGALNR